MDISDLFYGPNAGYALERYERYQRDPNSVDAATRAFFERLTPDQLARISPATPPLAPAPAAPAPAPHSPPATPASVKRIVAAARLARSIREYGHLAAHLDPLGTPPPGDPMLDPATHGISDTDLADLPATIVWPAAGPELGSCLDAIQHLRALYTGYAGYEFDHVQNFEERAWLHDAIESGRFALRFAPEERRALLERLTEIESFEQYLHRTFQGQKRFSLEGCDMLIPMLDEAIHAAARIGAREALIGMAHRGRLNVLAHILGKPYAAIFSEFHSAPNPELTPSEGSTGINYGWTGDVKYHLGARRLLRENGGAQGETVQVQLTMAHNPSHLEFVNPVVEGFTRAAQERRDAPGLPRRDYDHALALLVHGDAAFPGEGVVAETLNLSRLPGYETGGALHIIANNQIGFTTEAHDGRSTLYASDLAKGYEIPIIHVNADEPEACLMAIDIALAYRARFHKDALIDLVGYRRWGHNEGDEPAYTQPLLYGALREHPTVRERYARQLIEAQALTQAEADALRSAARERLNHARLSLNGDQPTPDDAPLRLAQAPASYHTAVPAERLRALNAALLDRPTDFSPNAKLEKQLQGRRDTLEQPNAIDWAHAESLAFASILSEGAAIRLTGQDSERGTFSQRHLVLHDTHTGDRYTPLQALPAARASFAVYNTPLSEAAPLGFEYGYSVHAPDALVLWEAQFGDFANAGQVLIDQFIAAARAKWRQLPALALLLPHGYEGQGPEHSSARIERYLQLAAEDNLRIANPTSAAQYFHLLRAQAASLRDEPRPLIVFTPKSLLREKRAASSLGDLTSGAFQPILTDPQTSEQRERVQRLLLCSGKVAIDLARAAERPDPAPSAQVAVARVEQLYPFPAQALAATIACYPNAREIVWLQEEPRTMGAWSYMEPRLLALLAAEAPALSLRYIGRPERAATAEGAAAAHNIEQARIIAEAFAADMADQPEPHDDAHARDQRPSQPHPTQTEQARLTGVSRGGQHVG